MYSKTILGDFERWQYGFVLYRDKNGNMLCIDTSEKGHQVFMFHNANEITAIGGSLMAPKTGSYTYMGRSQ